MIFEAKSGEQTTAAVVGVVTGPGNGRVRSTSAAPLAIGQASPGELGQSGETAFINACNGNLVVQSVDAGIIGRGSALSGRRTYNLLASAPASALAWRWDFDRELDFVGPGTPQEPAHGAKAIRTRGDGHTQMFEWNAGLAAFVGREGEGPDDLLLFDPDAHTWTWTDGIRRDRERYLAHGADGHFRLDRITDVAGNQTQLTYAGDHLAKVTDEATNQELLFPQSGAGPVELPAGIETRTLVAGPDGVLTRSLSDPLRLADYSYDAEGRLQSVARYLDPVQGNPAQGGVAVTNFVYDGASRRLSGLTNSDGTALAFAYDGEGRVATVIDGSAAKIFDVDYDAQAGTTHVDNGLGDRWTYQVDPASGSLLAVSSPNVSGGPVAAALNYDTAGNLVSVSGPGDRVQTLNYDAAGNCTLERDKLGATLKRKFGSQNQLLVETRFAGLDPDADGASLPSRPVTTRFAYDESGRRRFAVSAEGRVREWRYNEDRLASEIVYTDAFFDVDPLGEEDVLAETTLAAWIEQLADRSKVERRDFDYDLRGIANSFTRFAAATPTGEGVLDAAAMVEARTTDEQGLVTRRDIVRGTAREIALPVERYERDAIGRLTSAMDASGERALAYDDEHSRITTTLASGLVKTERFDSRGRLIEVQLSDGQTARIKRYIYDDGDRLRMVEDAMGGRTFAFYDAAGRVEWRVEPTGATRRYVYDEAGSIAAETRFAAFVDSSDWYDDASGKVVKDTISDDGATPDLVPDAAADRTFRYLHNAAGNLIEATDPEGVVTSYTWDGLARLIARQIGNRRQRYLYHRDGRAVGAIDPLGRLTESVFDAGGREIETIRYAAPIAVSTLPPDEQTLADLRPASDDEALHTRRYFDGLGRVIGEVGEQQYLTETVYDETQGLTRVSRYTLPVDVVAGDDLVSVRSRAGTALFVSQIRRDAFGRLTEATAMDGTTLVRQTFDAAGQLLRIARAAGTEQERVRFNQYDAFGNLIGVVAGEGASALAASPPPQDIDTAIGQGGTRCQYDGLGRRIRSVDANAVTTLFLLDRQRRRTFEVGILGDAADHSVEGEVTEARYNAFGETIETIVHAGRLGDTLVGQLLAANDGIATTEFMASVDALADLAGDASTQFDYDRCGRLVRRGDPEEGETLWRYDAFGAIVELRRKIAANHYVITAFTFDDAGRCVAKVEDAGGLAARSETDVDAFDRPARLRDPLGGERTITYPDKGRSRTAIDALGAATYTSFDARGRVIRNADPVGGVSTVVYDDQARTVTTTTAGGAVTLAVQNRHGESIVVTDARGKSWHTQFNRDGRQTAKIDPSGTVVSRSGYDGVGREIERTDARGTLTRLQYDRRNRLVEQCLDPDGLAIVVRFENDALGRRVRMIEAVGTSAERWTDFALDRKGRLRQQTIDAAPGGLQSCARYDYDGLDRRVRIALGSLVEPDRQVTLQSYDALGRLERTVQAPSAIFGSGATGTRDITAVTRYDLRGLPTRRIDANGASRWLIYDAGGRCTCDIGPLGEVRLSQFDAMGRPVALRALQRVLDSAVVAALGDAPVVPTLPPIDISDRRSLFVYDADYRARFTLNAVGQTGWTVSENLFDANGSLIELRAYDRYLAGDRVEALQAQGNGAIRLDDLQTELRDGLGYGEQPDALSTVRRTFFAHDANGRSRFTVDPLGAVSEKRFDTAGTAIAVIQHASIPTLADHEEETIAAAVQPDDPRKRRTCLAYDAAGRIRFVVDPLGAIVETRFDARGNAVASLHYRTALPETQTDFTEAALASAIASAGFDQNPVTTHVVYDQADRIRFAISPVGAVTENHWDSTDHLVAETRYADIPDLGGAFRESAVDTILTPLRADAGNRTRRQIFDPAGRLRFIVDAAGAVLEQSFDAVGNVIAVTRYAQLPTPGQWDEAGLAAVLVADPRNRISRSIRDASGQIRFAVDPTGAVQETVYDALGGIVRKEAFAVRPVPAQWDVPTLDATLAPMRGASANTVELQLADPLGRERFKLSRLEAGAQPAYAVQASGFDALGRRRSITKFADAASPASLDELGIADATGAGDPQRDGLTCFTYDLAGQTLHRLEAVSTDAGTRQYRASAFDYDSFGQAVARTDYASPITSDDISAAAIDTLLAAIKDAARDRRFAWLFDRCGRTLVELQALDAGQWRVTAQGFDRLGRLVVTRRHARSYETPDIPAAETVLQALAALTDAADRQDRTVYDAASRCRYVVRTDGGQRWALGESRYDAFGNVLEARRYDRPVTDAAVTGLGDPALSDEAALAALLAALGYDEAEPTTLALVQRTRIVFDALDRKRFIIDASGAVTENIYDALGDNVLTTRFADRPALPAMTADAIDAAVDRANPANRDIRHAYDAAGRLRFELSTIQPSLSGPGGMRVAERRYDALGRPTERLRYFSLLAPPLAFDEDALTAAVTPDPGRDERTIRCFDAGGRERFTLRELAGGGPPSFLVSGRALDARGLLLQRTVYASALSLAIVDSAALEAAIAAAPAGRSTTFVYDAAGRQRFEINADGSCAERVYDLFDQLLELRRFDVPLSTGPNPQEADLVVARGARAIGDGATRGERRAYDCAGRQIETGDALGQVELLGYDVFGAVSRRTDRAGGQWDFDYDRAGRKVMERGPAVAFKLTGEALEAPAILRRMEKTFRYDLFGQICETVDAANFPDVAVHTITRFDILGRPVGAIGHGYFDPASGTVEPQAAAGRVARASAIVYDAFGNTARVDDFAGASPPSASYRTYDAQGLLVHEINALGHVTRHSYDAIGRLATVTRYSVTIGGTPANGDYWTVPEIDPLLNYGRDELGNLIVDSQARTITLEYDKVGRKISVTQPTSDYYSTATPGDVVQGNAFRLNPTHVVPIRDAAQTQYEYDAFDAPILQRVRASTVSEWQDTGYTRDSMGRVVTASDAAGNVTGQSYDLAGNLVWQDEATGQDDGSERVTTFAWDVLNRQTRIDRYGLRYTDAAGTEHGVATWTYANGGEWQDPDAQTATTVRTVRYDALDHPVAVTDAGGNLTTMTYDALGRVVQVIEPERTIAPLAANDAVATDPFHYQLNETRVSTITFDPFGRTLRQVRATSKGGDPRITLQSYDAAGNLISTTDPEGNIKRRSYDAAGRIIHETQAIQVALGPLGINAEGLERRYHYDALGQLTDTLDVYGGTFRRPRRGKVLVRINALQSGKSVIYNAFGEIVEEQRKWGPAGAALETLSKARTAWYHFDNAGHVFEQVAADGLTTYYYNLLGQVTREEKRGDSSASWRITEYQHDILGRTTMVRKPAFRADVTPDTGTTLRLVTPYAVRHFDRWGNVTGTEEGGYEFTNGQPVWTPYRQFRSFLYDDNDREILQSLGTHGFTNEDGVIRTTQISLRKQRDLLGNIVAEIDESRDPQTDALTASRTRRKRYDTVGQLLAETDATNRTVDYARNIHGDRLGSRNALGTVTFERHDRNGNLLFRGVLRRGFAGSVLGPYDSRNPTGPIVRTTLSAFLFDQALRRYASKTFTDASDAPWRYTKLDGRNLGTGHSDAAGLVTHSEFDPFGNKSLEIDSAGMRSTWRSAVGDYAVGRIEDYYLANGATGNMAYGQYAYNPFGEILRDDFGDTHTSYDRFENGMVATKRVMPDGVGTAAHQLEITSFTYDPQGRLTSEGRIYPLMLQTIVVSYDNQGRLSHVEDRNRSPSGPICDVHYEYDEWSNVRVIRASYSPGTFDAPSTRDSWYDYDSAGRMTLSNGGFTDGKLGPKAYVAGSTWISYDQVGRRGGTTELLRHISSQSHVGNVVRSWDTMRDEQYSYDDLGHLRMIEQRLRQVNVKSVDLDGDDVNVPLHDQVGHWRTLSTRETNLRGDVTRAEQWSLLGGGFGLYDINQQPLELGTTTSQFRADGKLASSDYVASDPNNNTETANSYAAATGLLDYYTFDAFRTDGNPFQARFEYRYGFKKGQRVINGIHDVLNGLDTDKSYDKLGRLTFENIELQKPNGDGTDRYEERRYTYDAEGRVILKDSRLRLSVGSSSTVPLPDPSSGLQSFVYGGDRTVASVGSLRLTSATRFDYAYTAIADSPAEGVSTYVVQNGDTLVDIALACYGDAGMWYQIADANGAVGDPQQALPASEIGKAYEIPAALRSSQSSTTFQPYDVSSIFGNDRPIAVPPPRPAHHSDIEYLLVAAAQIAVQVVVTAGLSTIGVPVPISAALGAGLGNLVGQETSWELGMQAPGQHGIDWDSVGLAAVSASIVAVAGPLGAVAREAFGQVTGGFNWAGDGGPAWGNVAGSLFNIGFDALGPVLGGYRAGPVNFGIASLLNSAYNPASGWAVSGKQAPAVGAFAFAFGSVANGLVADAFARIKARLDTPTAAPGPRPLPRSVDALGPMSQAQIDAWDRDDAQYDAILDAARQMGIGAERADASQEGLDWAKLLGAPAELASRLGDLLDDSKIIADFKSLQNAGRVAFDEQQAQSRASAAGRAVRQQSAVLASASTSASSSASASTSPPASSANYGGDEDDTPVYYGHTRQENADLYFWHSSDGGTIVEAHDALNWSVLETAYYARGSKFATAYLEQDTGQWLFNETIEVQGRAPIEHSDGGVLGGVLDGAVNLVGGVYHMVRHPVETAKGIGHIAAHPIQTIEVLGGAIKDRGAQILAFDSHSAHALGQTFTDVGSLLVAPEAEAVEGADALRLVEGASDVGRGTPLLAGGEDVAQLTKGVPKGSIDELAEAGADLTKGKPPRLNAEGMEYQGKSDNLVRQGNAFGYENATNVQETADDIRRLTDKGFTEIHVGTGAHTSPVGEGGWSITEKDGGAYFYRRDIEAGDQVMMRHPDVQVYYYDLANPEAYDRFIGEQGAAISSPMPGVCTLGSTCYSKILFGEFPK